MTRGSDLNALSHVEVDVTELSEEGGPSLRECERMHILVKLTIRGLEQEFTLLYLDFFCMQKL